MTDVQDQQKFLLDTLFMLSGAKPKSSRKEPEPSKPPSTRGGSRPGSGRPQGSTRVSPELKRVTLAITIPQWLADSLTNTDVPPGRLVEAIIQFHLGSIEKIACLF